MAFEHPVLIIRRDQPTYGTGHKYRGTCLIINQLKFEETWKDKNCPEERAGSEKDIERLTGCFQSLGFDVKQLVDKKYYQIMAELEKESINPRNSESDCFLCIVSSHGNGSEICASDRKYPVTELFDYFSADKCHGLRGKPKIFMIQACRGSKKDSGSVVGYIDAEAVTYYTIPNYSDMLVMYSSYSGYVSYRGKDWGTLFLQTVAQVFEDKANDDSDNADFMELLTRVNNTVAFNEMVDERGKILKQMPCIFSTLTRKLYFPKKSAPPSDFDEKCVDT